MLETKKNRGGRPRVDATPITVRVPPDMLSALDALIDQSPDPKPSRPEAVRQVLATALNFVARDQAGSLDNRPHAKGQERT